MFTPVTIKRFFVASLVGLGVAISPLPSFSQSAVIRGELSPGNYINLSADALGALLVNAGISPVALSTATAATAVAAAGDTTLFTLNTKGAERIFVACVVAAGAAAALDAFAIQTQLTSYATPITLYNTAASFLNPTGILVAASSDLTTLAIGATGWFMLDVSGLDSVVVTASAAAGGSTVTCYTGGK